MKTNIQNKYKDKTPEETIKNIKDFFVNKGFIVEEQEIGNPMPNTWWCRVILKYNDIEIQGANGKGTTESFALASGYAELYERYCNFQNIIFSSRLNQNKFFELNYQKNGFYLCKDEVFLTPEDAINSSTKIINYCNSINDNINSLLKYFNFNYPNGILSLPFKGFNTNSDIILPFSLLLEVTGSSGCAAGNTIEEAFVQGSSELCEHYVENKIYYETQPFKKLNINNINININIKKYFEKLLKNNYSYSIFDFSYLYNVPVLGLYIIDLDKKVSYLNLGSSPIFEIALERCCTEIFQGHTILGDNLKNNIYALRDLNPYSVLLENSSSITFSHSYPDNFLLNFNTVDSFNKKIFLDNIDYTNQELTEYYKKLFNYLDWKVYYRDFSQSSLIKAIKLYIDNIDAKNAPKLQYNKMIPTLIKKRKWNILFKWDQIILEYFNTKILNQELLKQYVNLKNIDNMEYYFITDETLFNLELFTLPGLNKNININFDILYNSLVNKQSYGNFLNSIFKIEKQYSELFKYSILFNYKNKYTIDEIKQIAKNFNIEYTKEDFENKDDICYYLDKLYFSLFYNYYNSLEYKKLLNIFIP